MDIPGLAHPEFEHEDFWFLGREYCRPCGLEKCAYNAPEVLGLDFDIQHCQREANLSVVRTRICAHAVPKAKQFSQHALNDGLAAAAGDRNNHRFGPAEKETC